MIYLILIVYIIWALPLGIAFYRRINRKWDFVVIYVFSTLTIVGIFYYFMFLGIAVSEGGEEE